MKNHNFREHVDWKLAELVWDEANRKAVLRAVEKEEKPMRKRSTTVMLIAAILCISLTALAAGILFSPKYEAAKLANQALREQYGLTDDLLSLFHREVEEHADGTATVTYAAPRFDFPTAQMGDYTVEVEKNHATATWSNDGKDTSGGLAAQAFGPEQLHLLSYNYASTMEQLYEAGKILHHMTQDARSGLTESEIEQLAQNAEKKRVSEIDKAEKQTHTTAQKLAEAAQAVVCREYGLSEAQSAKLIYEPDSTYITYQDDQPIVNLLFWLWQSEDETFTEKDGQYWIAVNMQTGVIDDILYDAGLAGNG